MVVVVTRSSETQLTSFGIHWSVAPHTHTTEHARFSTGKWARVHWEINKDLLLDELSYKALDYCKEVIPTKTKLDQAIKAGYLPPRLYACAVKCAQLGWNVNLKILEPPESAWDGEGKR
jgi:hypothetical protein